MQPRNRLIGQPVARVEDHRFLAGTGCYVGDLLPPGLLHAAFLRSPVAHGQLRSLEPAAALALPGVRAVLSARDVGDPVPTIPVRQEPLPGMENFIQPVIAATHVRYVGEPIAVVLAETQAIAEDALGLIGLEIDELPPVADWRAAARGDVLLHERSDSNTAVMLDAVRGDADAAFADAPYTRRERFTIQRHSAVPMEPRGLLATWDAARGHLTLNGAAKVAFPNRRMLAAMMGLAEADVSLVENDNGGGFGVRGEFYPEDFLIPFAARRLGRPVRWLEDRREHMLASNHARDVDCELEMACTREGRILALRGTAHCDTGAYLRTAGSTGARNVAQVMSGPYRIPDAHICVVVHVTNKTPVGTYRGPGRFEADFCRERLIDIVAADLGLDRVAFRRQNLLAVTDHPWALATIAQMGLGSHTDGGDYAETFERCLAEFGWREKAALSGQLIEGRWHGIALGSYIEGGASGPREHVRLELDANGKVEVHAGSSSIGQGVETVFTQIAADALDLPMSSIAGVFHGSTLKLADGFGSYSSRSTVMGGSAILDAAAKLKRAWREEAAFRLACAPEHVVQDSDRLIGPDGRFVRLADLGAGLAADGVFASSKRTYSYGSHAAHVSVDPETGEVRVHDYVAVEDVGRAINPVTLHGQTIGSVAQGLGGALLEHLVYDEHGQLLTVSLGDYLMPTACEVPVIRATVLDNHPSPNNPLGAKGAGEGGIIPVGALVANAVADALRSFGARPNHLPLSPPCVWNLLRARAKAGAQERSADSR